MPNHKLLQRFLLYPFYAFSKAFFTICALSKKCLKACKYEALHQNYLSRFARRITAVAAMKTEMPNATLDLEIAAQDDDQKIKTYAASGNLPDLFFTTTSLSAVLKKSNNLLELTKYVKDLNIEDKLLPSTIPLLYDENGKCYAVPNVGQWSVPI